MLIRISCEGDCMCCGGLCVNLYVVWLLVLYIDINFIFFLFYSLVMNKGSL